jgi:hypothetical protein
VNTVSGFGLAFHLDAVDLEGCEFLSGVLLGARADHNGNAVVLRASLKPRSNIDGVAQHRIVEAEIGPHVSDHAGSGIQPDPDVQRPVCPAILVRLVLELLIELVGASKHFQRSFAGVDLLLRIVERRVPERHDRVADVFVDRAVAFDDGVSGVRKRFISRVRPCGSCL